MSNPYLGEIRMFGGNFAPYGWMFCEGQMLSIPEYETLFQLIGTTYGGDGVTTFALPDLRGRIPLHMGQGVGLPGHILAEQGGEESVTLTNAQMPAHTHALLARNLPADQRNPAGARFALPEDPLYASPSVAPVPVNLDTGTIGVAGGDQPHENLQPYLCVNFIISLFGIFPSPT